MSFEDTKNVNVDKYTPIVTPKIVELMHPSNDKIKQLVSETRKEIREILQKRSSKIVCVVGPCSIHNYNDALEYAKELSVLAKKYEDKLLIIMRVYFEKPRTTVGWKGFINDPDLNNTYDVNKGLVKARQLLVEINNMGLPCGCEMLDPFTPQYFDELISWGAIGARTCESQIHRQLVSGLSMPVGFKNTTSGNVQSALDGMRSASIHHVFFGIDNEGNNSLIHTKGNSDTHLILRGSTEGPNYQKEFVKECNTANVMIDCSHGNSRKDYRNQGTVLLNVLEQIIEERKRNQPKIFGVMIESNLKEGKQVIELVEPNKIKPLEKGLSVTDTCISIEETAKLLNQLFERLKND